MDGAVDATPAEQRRVRRVDDGVDVERRDVGSNRLDAHDASRPQPALHGPFQVAPCAMHAPTAKITLL